MVMMADGTLWECTEKLLVSETYKLFVVTGQPQTENGRRAYFTVRPFNTFDADSIAALKAQAGNADDPRGSVSIKPNRDQIEIGHTATRTSTMFPISKLDEDVRQRLDRETSQLWRKYLPAGNNVTTGAPVSVKKPLQLKNTP